MGSQQKKAGYGGSFTGALFWATFNKKLYARQGPDDHSCTHATKL
jgi:hypothetical protein